MFKMSPLVGGGNPYISICKQRQKDEYAIRISLLGLHPREMKTFPHRNMNINGHTSITHSSQKVETTQMSTNC